MYSFYTSLFFIRSLQVNISSLKYFTSKCNNLDVNCFEMTFLIGLNLKCDYNIELCNILSFDCGPLLFFAITVNECRSRVVLNEL